MFKTVRKNYFFITQLQKKGSIKNDHISSPQEVIHRAVQG